MHFISFMKLHMKYFNNFIFKINNKKGEKSGKS